MRDLEVLLVEDEAAICDLVETMLAEAGVRVTTASTGVDGLKLARSRRFDLILMDVVLPGMDGVTACRLIKAEPTAAGVPLVMLTARSRQVDVDAAMRAGADGYIHKPFRAAELLDLVARLAQSRG